MLALSRYELGHTALVASQLDQRFSYALYVPPTFRFDLEKQGSYDLIIAVHPSERLVLQYRDGFSSIANELDCFVFAPLFPLGILEQGESDNYKYLDYRGLRYDLLLLGMIAEVEKRYGVQFRRRVIHGFSGGGQFVHRFAYLHPEKLIAASVGAPGKVTLLDTSRDWWVGIRDAADRFGRPVNIDAVRKVSFHLVVGEEDLDEDEIDVPRSSPLWMPGADEMGRNRIDRIKTLHSNLLVNGVSVQLELVPGVSHQGTGEILACAARFLSTALRGDS
ncbi:alpha/beta hydrolase [Bradyrhizobium sp. AZCC 2230]|uniref:alpha/beta hydrolase n=1 Tax=Bradyrhizobium sp. AZCC 2230 TaxID=3117021 RepID=UPI002FF0F42A